MTSQWTVLCGQWFSVPKWDLTSVMWTPKIQNFEFDVHITTVLVKSFAHLNRNFFLASLEEIGKLLQWWTVLYSTMFKVSPPLSGGSQKIHSIKCAKLLTSTVKHGQILCIGSVHSISMDTIYWSVHACQTPYLFL